MHSNAARTSREVASALVTREALAVHGRVTVTCRGRSMIPTLRDGWPVEVVALGDAAAAVGDVVLIAQGTKLIVHRLVARIALGSGVELLVHRGDGHWRTAGLARGSSVIGVAPTVMRRDHGDGPLARWAVAAFAIARYAPRLAWQAARDAYRADQRT